MGRLLFSPPAVGAGDAVLIATDDAGTTPADIVSTGGGPSVQGGVLHATGDGSLPRFLGPADATATLYALTLDYLGEVAGDPVELTGVDLDAVAPGGSMPEPWTLDRAEYQSAGLEQDSGDKITWQIHGVDWGFTPLSLTDPQNPTIVVGGLYAVSAWASAYPAQPGKFGQLGLKLDDSNFGWHVFADAPLDGTDSPYGTGAMQASATVYLPAGAVVCTPVWHDVGAATVFNAQMIVQLIQAETTPDPDYDL